MPVSKYKFGAVLGCLALLHGCNKADERETATAAPVEAAPDEAISAPVASDEPEEAGLLQDQEAVRSADSHVHGAATLAIVLEDTALNDLSASDFLFV